MKTKVLCLYIFKNLNHTYPVFGVLWFCKICLRLYLWKKNITIYLNILYGLKLLRNVAK